MRITDETSKPENEGSAEHRCLELRESPARKIPPLPPPGARVLLGTAIAPTFLISNFALG